MADVKAFDAAGSGGTSSAGAVIHESKEQLVKTGMGLKNGEMGDYKSNYLPAHKQGTEAGDKVDGNTRIDDTTYKETDGTTTKQTITPNETTGRNTVVKEKVK